MGVLCTRTQVGDKYVYEEMTKRGSLLGGEPSGHIVFRKYASTGDGILTALKVAELILERKSPLSFLTQGYRPLPQKMLNVPVKGGAEIVAQESVRAAIARAEKGGVRMVVRPSGTEPLVRILAEGDESAAEDAARLVERAVLSCAEAL